MYAKHDIPIESFPAAPSSKIDVLEMTKPAGEPGIVSAWPLWMNESEQLDRPDSSPITVTLNKNIQCDSGEGLFFWFLQELGKKQRSYASATKNRV